MKKIGLDINIEYIETIIATLSVLPIYPGQISN